MVFSQKYCLVQLLTPLAIGDEFTSKKWPLHCTIAGVFALDWTDEVRLEFSRMIAAQQPFIVRTTDVAYFGPKHTVKVRRIAMTPELYELHEQVVTFIELRGGSFNEPRYLREHFAPHITMKADAPDEGVPVPFRQLALIDMFPDADHTRRRIIVLLPLGAGPF